MCFRRTARHLGDAVIGGHLRLGISRHGNTQYPMGKLDLHEGKSHKAVHYGITALSAEAVAFLVRSIPSFSSSRKVASRSRVHHRTSLHRWRTQIVKRIIDYRLSLAGIHLSSDPLSIPTILKVTHRRMPVSNPNSDIRSVLR
jgi:hypothetical protein